MNNTIIGLAITLIFAASCAGDPAHQKEALRIDSPVEVEEKVEPTPAPQLETLEDRVCRAAAHIGVAAERHAREQGYVIETEMITCEIPPPPHDNVAYIIYESKEMDGEKVIGYMWLIGHMVNIDGRWTPGPMLPLLELDYSNKKELQKGVLEVNKSK